MATEALTVLKFPIEVYDTLHRYYEFGQFIYDRIQTYHKAPEIVQEIQAFMEDMKDGVVASQIEIVEWMYQQPGIDEFTRRRVETLLKKLKSELLLVDDLLLNSFDKHGNLHRVRFTVTYQSKLDQSLATLKTWKAEFWAEVQVLQTRRSLIPDPLLLSTENFKPQGANWPKRPETGSMFCTGRAEFQAKNGQWRQVDVLVEDLSSLARLTKSGRTENELAKEAKAVAIELAKTMSSANVLTCLGYRDNPVQLVFEYPSGFSSPQTLRNLILTSKKNDKAPPLDYRFRLVRELADAIFLVLTAKPLNSKLPPGFVHKNIRPNSIVIFSPENPLPQDTAQKSPELAWTSRSKAYLTDWRKLRHKDQGSYKESDDLWTMNFYRHYLRQGMEPQDRYEMKHDLYSLAICLLEVGLWETFITVDGEKEVMSDFFVEEALRMPSVTQEDLHDGNGLSATTKLRDIFVSIADRHLPQAMGTPLTDLVKRCLKDEIDGASSLGGDRNLAALSFQNLVLKAAPQF